MSTLLNQANRGPGTFTSSSVVVPSTAFGKTAAFSAILQPATLADPTVTFGMWIEWLDPADGLWKFLVGSHDYFCGRLDKTGNPVVPSAFYTIPDALLNRQVRGVLDLPQSLDIGVAGSIA